MRKTIYLFVFGATIFFLTSCEKDNSINVIEDIKLVKKRDIDRPGSQNTFEYNSSATQVVVGKEIEKKFETTQKNEKNLN